MTNVATPSLIALRNSVRNSSKVAGAPICPHEGHGQMQHEPLGEEGEEVAEGEAESLRAA